MLTKVWTQKIHSALSASMQSRTGGGSLSRSCRVCLTVGRCGMGGAKAETSACTSTRVCRRKIIHHSTQHSTLSESPKGVNVLHIARQASARELNSLCQSHNLVLSAGCTCCIIINMGKRLYTLPVLIDTVQMFVTARMVFTCLMLTRFTVLTQPWTQGQAAIDVTAAPTMKFTPGRRQR